jgi:hypothetical protein
VTLDTLSRQVIVQPDGVFPDSYVERIQLLSRITTPVELHTNTALSQPTAQTNCPQPDTSQ